MSQQLFYEQYHYNQMRQKPQTGPEAEQ